MIRLVLTFAFLTLLAIGSARAFLLLSPAPVSGGSCAANITSTATTTDILTATATVVNNLTCH